MIADWEAHSISECCEILDSQRVPLNAEQRAKIPGNIPYYGANGVQGYINTFLFDEELILMAEDGGNFEQFATRPIAYKISGKSWVNNHAHILKAKSGFDKDFIFYSLVHKNILFFIQGGTRSKLNQSDLKSITLDIPRSIQEQSTIATILSTVDAAIEKTEQLIAKYERIKTGLMQDLLTRGIDEEENIRSEETHAFKDSPLGRIPVEWEVETLGGLVEQDSPIVYGILMPGYGHEGGIPVIKVKDIYNEKINKKGLLLTSPEIAKAFGRSKLKAGDLLFTIRGTVGRCAFVPKSLNGANITQDTARIRIKDLNPKFVRLYLDMPIPKSFIELNTIGLAVKGINLRELRKVLIARPKKKESDRIVERTNSIESVIENERRNLKKWKANKTALMQDLLTGKVRVDSLLEATA